MITSYHHTCQASRYAQKNKHVCSISDYFCFSSVGNRLFAIKNAMDTCKMAFTLCTTNNESSLQLLSILKNGITARED